MTEWTVPDDDLSAQREWQKKNKIATLELHSLKELIVLRKTVQDRMSYLKALEGPFTYQREDTIEYLTLGQILVRLPDPSLLTPHTCTQEDIPS